MDIRSAKEQVKRAMKAYFARDEFGEYEIPISRQRPVILMGPPGIGKTAIVEQIAQELGVGLVSYSMTHHTRQSALGLPYIETKTYGGREYSVSEYTMSEIIASVYDTMEETGVKEGILFLDEINCVSETLAPAMLQFLQFKTFGRHRVPDGWVIVTAGNPPEYNDSVREFDIVTWDRLKRIDIEPDYKAWKQYASEAHMHPAVITYLDMKESEFYRVESGPSGRTFVTARGWADLSDMIRVCEKNGIPVDGELTSQYIQNREISKSFALYYDLFNKYRSDYQVERIFAGDQDSSIEERASEAGFDERLSLLGLMLSGLSEKFAALSLDERVLDDLAGAVKSLRGKSGEEAGDAIAPEITGRREELSKGRRAGNLSQEDSRRILKTLSMLEDMQPVIRAAGDPSEAAAGFVKEFRKAVKAEAAEAGSALENSFDFCEKVFGEGRELLVMVTELTAGSASAHFISRYGSEGYYRHSKELMFSERHQEIMRELDATGAED